MNQQPWRYIYSSQVGSGHLELGTPCADDSVVWQYCPPDSDSFLVLVAADGAGTASRGNRGAGLVCEGFVDTCRAMFEAGVLISSLTANVAQSWVAQIVDKLKREAHHEGTQLREYASTLVAAIVGQEQAAFFQIGDGAIVVGDGDDYSWVFWPHSGEYANSTWFVTDEEALNVLQFDIVTRHLDEISLLTDGIQHLALKYTARSVHSGFFVPLFSRLRLEPEGESKLLNRELAAWLQSPTVTNRTEDDKTLILASRRPSS